jgi:hypothetical protein
MAMCFISLFDLVMHLCAILLQEGIGPITSIRVQDILYVAILIQVIVTLQFFNSKQCDDGKEEATSTHIRIHIRFVCRMVQMNSARGSLVYPEVEGSQLLLGYPLINVIRLFSLFPLFIVYYLICCLFLSSSLIQMGACTLLSHPTWRTASYPATLFTTAPLDLVQTFFDTLSSSLFGDDIADTTSNNIRI